MQRVREKPKGVRGRTTKYEYNLESQSTDINADKMDMKPWVSMSQKKGMQKCECKYTRNTPDPVESYIGMGKAKYQVILRIISPSLWKTYPNSRTCAMNTWYELKQLSIDSNYQLQTCDEIIWPTKFWNQIPWYQGAGYDGDTRGRNHKRGSNTVGIVYFLAPKKDDTLLLCMEFRKLTEVAIRDLYPKTWIE